jgi:hypothetical protein
MSHRPPARTTVYTCVTGAKEDEALLSTVTLEELRLVLNPFTRKLQPMRMMLA